VRNDTLRASKSRLVEAHAPQRKIWMEVQEQQMKSGFSKPFSRAWVLDLGH